MIRQRGWNRNKVSNSNTCVCESCRSIEAWLCNGNSWRIICISLQWHWIFTQGHLITKCIRHKYHHEGKFSSSISLYYIELKSGIYDFEKTILKISKIFIISRKDEFIKQYYAEPLELIMWIMNTKSKSHEYHAIKDTIIDTGIPK